MRREVGFFFFFLASLACRPYPPCSARHKRKWLLQSGHLCSCLAGWRLLHKMTGVRGPGESRDTAMAMEQDIFDAVVMADERFHGEGYQEGYEEGSSLGIVEGKQYGVLHGAKIGSEIGCYRGFALAWKCLLHSGAGEKERKMKVVEALITLLQDFPYDDPTYEKLHEDLERIRGKFRQLCSLLNVQPDFKVTAGGSGLAF
ncbi:protein LTO1 homolog isoform X3 [Rattus norvegicus]